MSDLFDPANYPTREPADLVVGDRWAWKRADLGAVYAPASYTLRYSARLDGAATTEIEITASASGAEFVIEVPASTTATYTAGRYHWQAYIIRNSDSERITVDLGVVEVQDNADASTADQRSHARKMLDLIETALEGHATAEQLDVLSSALGDVNLNRDPAKLIPLRDKYRAEVVAEEKAEKIRRGEAHGGRILTRFVG